MINNLFSIFSNKERLNIKDYKKLIFNWQIESKKQDNININKLRDIIKQYDVSDFLKNVSALMLFPENQSKSVIFQCMISTALSIPKDEIYFSKKMSHEKFKQTVKEFENLNLKSLIDPPEFPFILPIMYYGNYNLFMGASTLSPETIQAYIKVFVSSREDFSEQTQKQVHNLIIGFLTITQNAVDYLKISMKNLKCYNKDDDIFIPNSNTMFNCKKIITLSRDKMDKLFPVNLSDLTCDYNCVNESDITNFDAQYYYLRPFLKNNDEFILLDISILSNTLMHKLLEYTVPNSKSKIMDKFRAYMDSQLNKQFEIMGNWKFKANLFNLKLKDDDEYKEFLFSNGNDGAIVNVRLYDNCENYNFKIFNNEYFNNFENSYISNRINYILKNLVKYGVKKEKILIIFTPISIGRNMYFSLAKKQQDNLVILSPYEISSIFTNEMSQNMFFQRYITARKKLKYYEKNLFSELNIIALYVKNGYSFYFGDELDTKDSYLNIIGEYSFDYILKAYLKNRVHLVRSHDYRHLLEITKLDDNLYTCPDLFYERRINKVVEFDGNLIWVITDRNIDNNLYDVYINIIDVISFWLIELRTCFDNCKNNYFQVIQIYINADKEELFKEISVDDDPEKILKYNIKENKLELFFDSKIYNYLNVHGNFREKELMYYLMNVLKSINSSIFFNESIFNKIFSSDYKKKTLSLNVNDYPYLLPLEKTANISISRSDENIILDDIGLFISKKMKINVGEIEDNKILNDVVDYLYNELKDKLRLYDKEKLIKYLYINYENIISKIMIRQKAYAFDLACYPNHSDEINQNFNELNKTSVSLKFLVELASSFEKGGSKDISEYGIEYLLAVSSQIIEWAYYNDLFNYGMIDSKLRLLKSNRLGFSKELINSSGFSLFKARMERINVSGRTKAKELEKIREYTEINYQDFETAFEKEFGYNFSEFTEVTIFLLDNCNTDVINEIDMDELTSNLSTAITGDKVKLIVSTLSLKSRKDFLKPPIPFRKEDVYPWRFNRELSFSRRPLILINNKILWGYRSLSNSIYFFFDLIKEGRLNAKSKEMKKYISLVNNAKGTDFNNLVYNYISKNKKLIVKKNVNKINKKRLVDEMNQPLGDIDVLYISVQKKLIVLVETKSFSFAKNFYEIQNEYKKMFAKDQKNSSFLAKHKKRVEWVKNNLSDLIEEYNLPNKNWNIKYMFVVDDYLVSKDVFKINEKIVTLNNLDDQELFKF